MAHHALEPHRGVYRTLFHPIVILEYMQRHKIFEIISELMIRVGIERPSNEEQLIDFMIMKLVEIAKTFGRRERNVVKIEFHNCCDAKALRELSMRAPLVEYCRPDSDEEERKLCNRHLIVCDFTDKSPPKPHKCRSKELKYLISNIGIMRKPSGSNIQWNRRLLFVGRLGSGRRTQASLLSRELGLNLIDWTLMDFSQQCDMTLAQERLLKPDCLCNGYAIVSNVISKATLEILVEKFIHPPNQIIFIHTNEDKCRRRILRRHEGISASYRGITSPLSAAPAPVNLNVLLNYHMDLYNLHKHAFVSGTRGRIYHVNGNGSVSDTKTSIWALVARS
jgi:hypothetical protein